jgi:pyruvate dehydrogenase E1 component beta subunit
MDAIVNQAANWNHMFGGGISVPLTVRTIINRGGEQGAQHSQALHAWFAHVPGLRVVMPSTPADARDLLIASVLSDDPVMYIDDRWLYETKEELGQVEAVDLRDVRPRVRREGSDITLVSTGYGTSACLSAAELTGDLACEVVDVPIIHPMMDEDWDVIRESYGRTRRLLVVDGAWGSCGWAASVAATMGDGQTLTLAPVPAPTSGGLEADYYRPVQAESVAIKVRELV